jgi:hypothetical protein
MPRTVDHIVATHQLAQERRDAGLPIWDRKLDLSAVFHNTDMTFEERRDAIVRTIKANPWYKNRDTAGFDEFGDNIEYLAGAEDVAEFDEYWDFVYDQADGDRVWIQTR